MAWDDAAINMAVNVIAKVEGAGAWDAINYNDPITIGLMQWYGTRAAGLLTDIQEGNPTQYANIAASLRNDHAAHSDNSRWWTDRYLTTAEGNTLKPVLRAVKDIQGALVASDVEDYAVVASRHFSLDDDTDAVIFFMCMYHQAPAHAINVVNVAKRITPRPNLFLLHQVCFNFAVFSQYRTRYTTAYNIIRSGVPPTIIELNDDDDDIGDGGGGSNGIPGDDEGRNPYDAVRTGIKHIEVVGSQLILRLVDDKSIIANQSVTGYFQLAETKDGVDVDRPPIDDEELPPDDPDPDPPTGDDAEDKRNALVKFMTDRIGTLKYSQSAARYPITSGYADCSSLVRTAYEKVLGINPGTYTDDQVRRTSTRLVQSGVNGQTPNVANMRKGDLVITGRYNLAPNRIASHVEIYMGNGQTIGHGGVPYMGPVTKSLAGGIAGKARWWIKRAPGL